MLHRGSPSPLPRLEPSYILASGTEQHSLPPPSYRASVHAKSSLDLSQRFERKLAQYNAFQNVFKRWLFEILSLTTSTICMLSRDPVNRKLPALMPLFAIIVGLCVYTKDKPLSK